MKTRPRLFRCVGIPSPLPRALMAVFAFATAASAGPTDGEVAPRHEIGAQIGWIHVLDHGHEALMGGLDLRLGYQWNQIRPWAALFVTESDGWAVGGGLLLELPLTDHLRVTVGSGPFYYESGSGPYLGHDLEFHSFFEVAWIFRGGARLGVRVGHFSNAGIAHYNPGTETVGIQFSLPLGR